MNGKKVRDGSATDYQVELGTGRLLDGLEQAIVGMREGETREATTVLPAEADKKFAGKEAVFTITLKELKRRILPELDDSFAKDVSEFETLQELTGRHRAADPRARRGGRRGRVPQRGADRAGRRGRRSRSRR